MQLPTRRLLARVATPLLAASMAVSACSTSGQESIRATSEDRPQADAAELTAADVLRGAADAPEQQGSLTMEMTMDAGPGGTMVVRGVFSADGRDADMTMTSPMGGGDIRVLIVDGVYYYAFPGLPAGVEWVSMSPEEMAESTGLDPSAAGGMDGTSMLEALRGLSDDIEEVGTDELFGVPVTRYRATISGAAAVQGGLSAGTFSEEFAGIMEDALPESYTMDVWIDRDGLPRRQTWTLDMTIPGEGVQSFSYRVDYPEWGTPIDVTAPAPDTVMSVSDLAPEAGGPGD